MTARQAIIIGFDPGETTGYARLDISAATRKIRVQDYGLIPVKTEKFYTEVSDWVSDYLSSLKNQRYINKSILINVGNEWLGDPDIQIIFAMEAPIPRRIAPGGQVRSDEVRGIIKAIAERHRITYFLYQATSVKKSFGSGRYTKAQLRRVVQMVLKTGPLKSPDVADALAVATCCALREFKADLGMENSYLPAPRKRQKKKRIEEYTDEEIGQAVRDGTAVIKGKRIIKIL